MSELEPDDSRNVTGTAATPDGRWTNVSGKTPSGVSGIAPGGVSGHAPSASKKAMKDSGDTAPPRKPK